MTSFIKSPIPHHRWMGQWSCYEKEISSLGYLINVMPKEAGKVTDVSYLFFLRKSGN